MQISEILALAFTFIFAENAVFTSLFGTDEIYYIGSALNSKKNALAASLVFISASALNGLLTYLSVRYIFSGIREMAVILSPMFSVLISFCISFGISRYIKRPQKSVGYLVFPLAVNTATVGISASIAADNIITQIILTAALSLGVIFSYTVFTDVMEKANISRQPKPLRGIASALIAIGLIAMVFSEISGIDLL